MTSSIAAVVHEANARSCVECGKCSAACSMAAMYPDFSSAYSPRGIVQLALRQAAGNCDGAEPSLLWRCLQCGNCTAACPEGVDCAGLIARLRARMENAPERSCCAGCGREIPALPVREWLRGVLGPDAPGPEEEGGNTRQNTAYLGLCPVCRRQVYAANNAAG